MCCDNISIMKSGHLILTPSFKLMYAALLRTLTTSHILLIVGSNWELPNAASNCRSRIFSFQFSESKLSCRSYNRSKWRFSFSFRDSEAFPCVFNGAYILRTLSNVNVARLSFVSILDSKSCYSTSQIHIFNYKARPHKAYILDIQVKLNEDSTFFAISLWQQKLHTMQ